MKRIHFLCLVNSYLILNIDFPLDNRTTVLHRVMRNRHELCIERGFIISFHHYKCISNNTEILSSKYKIFN